MNVTDNHFVSDLNKLREEHPDLDPALVAWGDLLTYDVDADGLTDRSDTPHSFTITHFKHLVSRGLVHDTIGERHHITALPLDTVCVPARDEDYWSFYIDTELSAYNYVKINGKSESRRGYQKVRVPNSLDQVEVQFVVVGGPETTLTITCCVAQIRIKSLGLEIWAY